MNQAEYLCHSSGPWKKHKYFQKIGEGANAVYRYTKQAAKDTAGKITGDYYDSQANKHQKDADFYNHEANRHFDLAVKDAGKERTDEEDAKYNEYWKNHQRMMDANFDRQQVSEKAASDAKYKADHSIGEKITGKRSKARMAKYAKGEYKGDDSRYASEKKKYDKTLAGRVENVKKRLKHDDFNDYAETAERGHAIVEQVLNGDYLEHSSGPWKKHKYFQKIGEGANAVYRYAKQKGKEAADKSGLSTRAELEKNKDWARMDSYNAKEANDEYEYTKKLYKHNMADEDELKRTRRNKDYWTETARGESRTANELQKQYDKTPLGKAEAKAKKIQKKVDDALNPPTKITVTSNLAPAGTKHVYYERKKKKR